MGYCQRLVTGDLDQAERVLDDASEHVSSIAPTRSWRKTCR